MKRPTPISFPTIDDLPSKVISLATMEHNHTGAWRYIKPVYQDKVPPCSNRCPAGADIEGFLGLIAAKRYTDAWLKLKEENPLTRVCGRVCFHPCETACNRRRYDLPVAIHALERFAGEHADRSRLPGLVRDATGKTVAVVGSGPAGLTAASYLARMGHAVTVFERADEVGGMLRYGIPAHRLPRAVLDDEVEDIRSLGVTFRCGTAVGRAHGMGFDELSSFDAVFLAVGAYRSRPLGVAGEDTDAVISGLDLLARVARGETVDVGARAAVIGGGNTALDAARVLVRLGVDVDLYYRRGRAEMPAFDEEVEEALREGVRVHTLVAPTAVGRGEGAARLTISMTRMRLGDPDASGRRRPVPIAGSEHDVDADSVIACVGEIVDAGSVPDGLDCASDGSVRIDGFGASNVERVWAGGDVTPNDRTVVSAIGMGKRAAVAIDRSLRGDATDAGELMRVGRDGNIAMSHYLGVGSAHLLYDAPDEVVTYEQLNPAHFTHVERARQTRAPFPDRLDGFPEVNHGLEEPHAVAEADRCFHCGVCTECDNCFVFCPDVAITPRADARGYELDYDFCKGCGICVRECPRASMTMVEE